MAISQKCQYAVRAVLELAKKRGQGPIPISEIAAKQAIPPRFLEIILNELKQHGLVESRRGVQGGYMLAAEPQDINVGQVIRLIDGPTDPVKCIAEQGDPSCPLRSQCALIELWTRAKKAMDDVYDSADFATLVERERDMEVNRVASYTI